MKSGYNTNGLVHHRLDEALEMIASTGFQVVALTLDVLHLDPLSAGPSQVDTVARQLDRLGLKVVVETGGRFLLDPLRKHRPNLLETDPADRSVRRKSLERSLEIARDLGAETMSLWPGVLPEGISREEGERRLRLEIDTLLKSAEAVSVRLAMEPEPGHLLERVDQWATFAEDLNPDLFGLCLDVGHVLALREGPIDQVISGIDVDRLFQVHLEDGEEGVHMHHLPGEGSLDFKLTLESLEKLAYRGPICWELSRHSYMGPQALAQAWQCWQRYAPPR